jgi:hypothetical protein
MPHFDIKRWDNGNALFGGEYESLRACVEAAVRQRVELFRADLRSADLYSANLYSANLCSADLCSANLRSANLCLADLYSANLAWQSHDLLAEILRRAAGDEIEKLKVAGAILLMRDKCWQEFSKLAQRDPLGDWALDTLAEWVQPDDGAPDIIRQRHAAKLVAT